MKRIMSVTLALVMCLAAVLSSATVSYGDTIITYQKKTFYHLDLGCIYMWSGDSGRTWQNGIKYGTKNYHVAYPVTFAEDVESAKVYPLNADSFQWNVDPPYSYNDTDLLKGKSDWMHNYDKYRSSGIRNYTCTHSGKTVSISCNVDLSNKSEPFDLAELLRSKNWDLIYALIGGKDKLEEQYPDIAARMQEAVDNGGQLGDGVLGYAVFVPMVIETERIVAVPMEPGDFEAHIDAPATVKAGETFNVTDKSIFADKSEFGETQLRYSVDGGPARTVAGWKGDDLGETITQVFNEPCTVKYDETVWNNVGDPKADTKTVNVVAEGGGEETRDIQGTAILELPDFTYEGHTELAEDQSVFTVDGIPYSAKRAYAEGIAENWFHAASPYVKINQIEDTKAECTFSKRGTYDVDLVVDDAGGGQAKDTESIEVRKTPYINASVNGFQKQNREQDLDITVGTYPGKPLTDYTVFITDDKTGQEVKLTKDAPQANCGTIKTRAMDARQDTAAGFTYITVKFLTKTPEYDATGTASQSFSYRVDVADIKGDTDHKTGSFTVAPDLPPVPSAAVQAQTIREKGTNTAVIEVQDYSTTDGDQLERTWTAAGTDVKYLPRYKDASFGAGQSVSFHQDGVGPKKVDLHLREVWIEPTLEEYVTEADHETADTSAVTDVINIAPTVRLEPKNMEEADVALMATKQSEAGIRSAVNAVKAALIEAGIDPRVSVIPQATPDSDGYRKTAEVTWPTTVNCGACNQNGLLFDSEYCYRAVSSGKEVSGYQEICRNPHTVHAMKANGTDAWTYTVNQFTEFRIQLDEAEKYVYLVSSYDAKNTIVLNRKTGAYLTTFPVALPAGTYVTVDDGVYILTKDSIQKYSTASGTLKTVSTAGGYLGRLANGKLAYVVREGHFKFSLAQFDLTSEQIRYQSIPELPEYAYDGKVSEVIPADMDSTGKVLFAETLYDEDNDVCGNAAWIADYSSFYVKSLGKTEAIELGNSIGFVKDESGAARYLYYGIRGYYGTSRYRYDISLYTLGDRTSEPIGRNVFSDIDTKLSKGSSVSYARYHSDDKCIYIMVGSTYQGSDWGGSNDGLFIKLRASDFSVNSNYASWGWDKNDEEAGYNDYLSAVRRSYDNWMNMSDTVKIFRHSITADQARSSALSKFADFRDGVAGFVEDAFSNAANTAQSVIDAVANRQTMVITNKGTTADSIRRSFDLEPGRTYYYEYELKDASAGSESGPGSAVAVQAPSVSFGKTSAYPGSQDLGTLNAVKIYREDFNDSDINPYFTVASGTVSGSLRSPIPGKSSRTHDIDSRASVTFNVPAGVKAIAIFDVKTNLSAAQLDYGWKSGAYVNGRRYEMTPKAGVDVTDYTYPYLLPEGINTIQASCVWSGYGSEDNYTAIDNLRVIYLDPSAKQYSSYVVSDDGDWKKVTGSFEVPIGTYKAQAYTHYPSYAFTEARPSPVSSGQASYTFAVPDGMAAKVYASAWGQASMNNTTQDLWTPWVTLRHRTENGSDISMIGDELFYAGEGSGPLTFWGREYVQGKYGTTYIKSGYNYFELFAYPSNLQGRRDFFLDNFDKAYCAADKYTGTATISILFGAGTVNAVKDLRIYYLKDGKKVYIENKAMNAVSDAANWTVGSSLSLSMAKLDKPEKEDSPMVYKKGQLVAYNIFYDDYENDPSQKQFWRYTHTPYNDGPHPEAATILDEDGNVVSSNGKVLTESIPRFYIDGKYTVEHWQMDNTNRTGDASGKVDYSKYDKLSNVESLTFYIEGGGTAPWITSIKTVPATVKEGDKYKLQIGVDDAEKDELRLTTELYKDKKLIYTHKQSNIIADANGNYPITTTGYAPTAAPGVYDVVCTVRDWSGAGIGTYRFTVVSEGKITGLVNHTDQWDDNRKKYNLKRFGEEINRVMQLDDYVAMATPRMRGANVFWSGEKFMLRAETEGKPSRVEVSVQSVDGWGIRKNTGYSAELRNTGKKTAAGAELWEGSLWDRAMINKWGRKNPEPLYFIFTASYVGGATRTDEAMVIIDSRQDYWQLHRLW